MTTLAEQALDLYTSLLPEATMQFNRFITTRTPPELQADMAELVDNNVTIAQGASVVVVDAADAPVVGSPGTANIENGAIANVKLGAG